jgi:hypothetical protein
MDLIMRFKQVLLCVGLALIVIQRVPSVASMPQIDPSTSRLSSQFTSNTSGGDVRQSACDPLGYDSGFWRTEYAARAAEQDQHADDNPIAVFRETRPATAQNETANPSADKASGPFVYSDNLAVIPIETAVIMSSTEFQAVGEPDELAATTQTDWEYAAVNATGGSTVGSTKPGPSVTSAIVGFVGIIIVIGAYVSSGNRNQ